MVAFPGGRAHGPSPAAEPGPTARQDLVLWAALEAGRLLADLPDRWRHTQEVAVHAWWTAVGLPAREQQLLVAAAYLHDVGYAPELVDTGFHPLDGARHLLRLGQPALAALVAHHSGAAVEARLRGLEAELAAFPPPDGPVADALTYSDLTTGPHGETVDPGVRLAEVVARHGPASVVGRARTQARVDLFAAVVRTLRRVARNRPAAEPLSASPLRLACTTLVRLEGALDSPRAVAALRDGLREALADAPPPPHALVLDLALLEALSPEGARALADASARTGLRAVLLGPPAPVRAALERAVPDAAGAVVDEVEAALAPACGC